MTAALDVGELIHGVAPFRTLPRAMEYFHA
jgi:hypothetical protein